MTLNIINRTTQKCFAELEFDCMQVFKDKYMFYYKNSKTYDFDLAFYFYNTKEIFNSIIVDNRGIAIFTDSDNSIEIFVTKEAEVVSNA